ncbi:MAG: hypothetical protein ACXWUG_01645 [Polyangiales bacterium]
MLEWFMPNVNGRCFREQQLAGPRSRSIPVIVCSAAPRLSAESSSSALSGCRLLAKPFEIEILLEEIAQCLDQSAAGGHRTSEAEGTP